MDNYHNAKGKKQNVLCFLSVKVFFLNARSVDGGKCHLSWKKLEGGEVTGNTICVNRNENNRTIPASGSSDLASSIQFIYLFGRMHDYHGDAGAVQCFSCPELFGKLDCHQLG